MPLKRNAPPFMGTKYASSPMGANVVIFGAPHGTPYRGIDNRVHAKSADQFRLALKEDSAWLEHWDFDLNGPLIPNADFKAVDLGNLATTPRSAASNRNKIEKATSEILQAGATPIMFGGDDSTPVPFMKAFSGGPPLTILQLDAHIDWRDERSGESQGFSSTMRRSSEQPHVWRIVQAGARGLGSARKDEVDAAHNWGSHIVPSRQIHNEGLGSVLGHIEPDSDCLILLDLDVLDSAVMPAVAYPSPGGLSFVQLTDLISGVAAKARIAGFSMVEFVPKRDLNGTAAFTAARVAANVLGHLARRVK